MPNSKMKLTKEPKWDLPLHCKNRYAIQIDDIY